ncbi:uncharacterized protein LOC119730568 [Patiria miniata]|uniref:Uncharacterized protein n=1 Tax=Patiria miniata TaxID=46514 RepID=A0A914A6I5_PATMI|nr:uncharacterized protein LOC119730568 [Patiria miniata]
MDNALILGFAMLLSSSSTAMPAAVNGPPIAITTRFVPPIANEGEKLTFSSTFDITKGTERCKPKGLQFVQRDILEFDEPDVVMAEFDKVIVDDYRLHVALDTSKDTWVYNLTIDCVTRLNTTFAVAIAGMWDCPGLQQKSCIGLPIKVKFSSTDPFPICPSNQTPGNSVFSKSFKLKSRPSHPFSELVKGFQSYSRSNGVGEVENLYSK